MARIELGSLVNAVKENTSVGLLQKVKSHIAHLELFVQVVTCVLNVQESVS